MKIKKFIIDNTLNNPVNLAMPNSYELKLIMPGVQTLEIRYCADYKENPDKIFNEFLEMYKFIKNVEDNKPEVQKVEVEVALTREAIWKMDEVAIDNLAKEKGIEFGRIKNLDSKKWKIINELEIPETPEVIEG